eukprot:CAMPEP_0196816976 /NCGR_PEP_ID=MMETSP1362-20130617/57941_1 /TAXON_ID=163516 /ORGANISM="Leptocylindrus danicus, Strain CCMP1856" /LENGTH=82 /DNA_ID=CAMNT_0042194477 /DNA_START=33 /DNA_END=277 /DNA_ORIENTATION=+
MKCNNGILMKIAVMAMMLVSSASSFSDAALHVQKNKKNTSSAYSPAFPRTSKRFHSSTIILSALNNNDKDSNNESRQITAQS